MDKVWEINCGFWLQIWRYIFPPLSFLVLAQEIDVALKEMQQTLFRLRDPRGNFLRQKSKRIRRKHNQVSVRPRLLICGLSLQPLMITARR